MLLKFILLIKNNKFLFTVYVYIRTFNAYAFIYSAYTSISSAAFVHTAMATDLREFLYRILIICNLFYFQLFAAFRPFIVSILWFAQSLFGYTHTYPCIISIFSSLSAA